MPVIHKQTATAPRSITKPLTGKVVDRIRPVTTTGLDRLKVAIFGNTKTGKTRLACTFPKPLLIIGTEDGTDSVVGSKGVEFVQIERSEELLELTNGQVASGRWASVVLDNGTKLRDLRIAELWKAKGGVIPNKKPFLYADSEWKEVWTQCSQDMRDLMGPLLDLPRKVTLNVIVIAQEQDFTSDNAVQSEVIKPVIGSALGKAVCGWLHAECSYLLHTFIREQTVEKSVALGNETVKQTVKTGKKEFCLRVGPHEVYWTGFRQHLGAPELPEYIISPTYEKILKLIKG